MKKTISFIILIIVYFCTVITACNAAQASATTQALGVTPTSGLVGYWKFDETSGTTANDSSGNGNNGRLTSISRSATWTTGKVGGALSFNGLLTKGSYVSTPKISLGGVFTMSYWYYDKSTTNPQVVIGESNGVMSGPTVKIGFNAGKYFIRLNNNYAESSDNSIAMATPALNTWHHVVLTRDSSDKVDLYIDGGVAKRLFSNNAQPGRYIVRAIGANGFDHSQTFDGLIDEVRLYNRTLTPSEINVLYTSTAGPVTPPADTTVPTTPSNLTAAVISSSQINLTWTASTDNIAVTGYKIYRNGTQIATSQRTSYSNTGLSPSTAYTYTVSAYDAAGNSSSQSSQTSATTQAAVVPPTPGPVAYYVANAGNDACDGKSSTIGSSGSCAWKTISKVNSSSFSAGSSILFNKGDTWREQLTVPSSGSSGNPITFGAYGSGEKPVINGADLTAGSWAVHAENVYKMAYTLTAVMVVVDEVIYEQVANVAALVANTYYLDDGNNLLYIYSTSDPNGRTVEVSARNYGIYINVKQYITIQNIKTQYAAYAGVRMYGNQANGYCIIDGVVAYANRVMGIVADNGHYHDTVQNCITSYNGNGIEANSTADYMTIINNTSFENINYSIVPNTDGVGDRIF